MKKPKAMESFDKIEVGNAFVYLNDKKAPQKLQQLGSQITLHSFIDLDTQCPFCENNLITYGTDNLSDDYYGSNNSNGKEHYLWYCRNCRFWQWYYFFDEFADEDKECEEQEGCPPSPEQYAYVSKLREFDENLPSSCSKELAQYLRSRPDEWNRYDPRRFEKLVADIFRANYQHAEVIHVGKPDDGGVDIILVESQDEQWLVQVKRREKQNSSEGVSTIRNLLGTMVLEGKTRGIVVSTADHFTLRAQQATQKLKKQGFHIELIDRGILNRMIEPVLPDRPWIETVKSHDPEIANWLLQRISNDNQPSLFKF